MKEAGTEGTGLKGLAHTQVHVIHTDKHMWVSINLPSIQTV